MYSHIKGVLVEKKPSVAVVECSGVGYEIHIPLRTCDSLPSVGNDAMLFTHFHVREDIQKLFGFHLREDREFFRMILGISGIGPAQALGILSAVSGADFMAIVRANDKKTLTKIPGIGVKKAEKIIFEFKDIVHSVDFSSHDAKDSKNLQKINEVDTVLKNLGYSAVDVQKALAKLKGEAEKLSVEELIRAAINILFE